MTDIKVKITDNEGTIFDVPITEFADGLKGYVLKDIQGEGKGGKGHVPYEYPNTLRTIENALSLIALGEGPFASIDHIYLEDTDVDSYPDIGYECRLGESSQSVIPGFTAVMAATSVATVLSCNVGVVRDVSSAAVDAMLVTIQLDSLFQVIDFGGMDGDIYGYGIDFLFDYRTSPTAGWVNAFRINIQGKTMTPYSQGFMIGRPAGGGLWGVRVTRVTRDDPSVKFSSVSKWSAKTETTYLELPYNNTALCGLMADAKSTGGSVPTYSFEVHAQKIMVPSNYNPVTRVYTGVWNGTFSPALQYCENPAFISLTLLTNTRFGMGIPLANIDIYSFYNAATYSDQMVLFKNEKGVSYNSPRFAYNGVIQTKENAYQLIQAMASCMRAYIVDLHGLLTCVQDRPTTPDRIFTNANVIDGIFEYNSNQLNERYTQVNVTWNDPEDRFKQRITSVPFDTDHTYDNEIAKYSWNPIDLAAMGCTNEAQAYMLGRYYLDNSLMTPENVQFKAGIENAYLAPGEVVYVADEHYAGKSMGGRIVAATTTSIDIDREINVTGSGATILVYDAAGNIMTGNIQGNGLMGVIPLTAPLAAAPAPNSAFVINMSTLSPRPFRISKLSLLTGDALGQIEISGSFYDVNKFARVDGTAQSPPPIFTDPGLYNSVAPKNVSAKVIHVTDTVNNNSWVNILFKWQPGDTNAYTYKMKWSHEGKPFVEVNDIGVPEYAIDHCVQGLYDIRLYAINSVGSISPETNFQYTYGKSNIPGAPGDGGKNPSGLLKMTQFFVKDTGGTSFTGRDLSVTWIDPNTSGPSNPVVAKYAIRVYKPDKVTLIREYIIEKIHLEFNYWYSMNIKDFSDASRIVYMEVYGVDAQNRYSPPCPGNFTNPAPVAPSFTVMSGTETVWVNMHINPNDLDDFAGFQVCRSPTKNFVKGVGTLVYDGPDSVAQLNIPSKVLYWYSVAAYDSFGKTTLNWATEQSSMPLSLEAIIFTWTGTVSCNAANKTLYWTQGWVVRDGIGFLVAAGSKVWSVGRLYLYWDPSVSETVLQTTTSLGLAVGQGCYPIAAYDGGDNKTLYGGDGFAFFSGSSIIAGTVGAAQLIAGSAVITGTAQIANAIINNAHIQDAAITNAKISGAIQSTNYNPGAHTGWQADKNGDIETYGSLNVYDNLGNPVITTGGVADMEWKKLTSSGNIAPNFDQWTKSAGAWVNKNEPWAEDNSSLIIPTNKTGYTTINVGTRIYRGNWYTVSFKAYCEKDTRHLAVDFFPDTLPQQTFVITTTPTVYTWTFVMPNVADVTNCVCRIWNWNTLGYQMHIMDFQVELSSVYHPWKACNDNYINWINTLSPENIGVFMPRASIGSAQIMNASINTLMLQGNIVTVPALATTGRTGNIGQGYWSPVLGMGIGGQQVTYPILLTFGGVYGQPGGFWRVGGNLQARLLQNGNQIWYACVASGDTPAGCWAQSTIAWVPANTTTEFRLDYTSWLWTSVATESNFITGVACKR